MVRARARSTGPEGWAWTRTTRTADMSNLLNQFKNPGPEWVLPPAGTKRRRDGVDRLMPELGSGKVHRRMRIRMRFAGENSVEIDATIISEARVEEEPEVVLIEEEPVLNTDICPACRAPLEFEVVTSFDDAFCVV